MFKKNFTIKSKANNIVHVLLQRKSCNDSNIKDIKLQTSVSGLDPEKYVYFKKISIF